MDPEKGENPISSQTSMLDKGLPDGKDLTSPRQSLQIATSTIVVTWDGDSDPANPINFPRWRKWTLVMLCAITAFWSGLGAAMLAPTIPDVMRDLGSDNKGLGTFVITAYPLGIAFGPLFLAPLSELYGRLVVQHTGAVGLLIFTIACGLSQNLSTMIGMRFLAGVFSGAPMTNGGAIISDMMAQEERGRALSIFTFGMLVGPTLGPTLGPFLSEAKGWRWIFWVISIGIGTTLIFAISLWRETYAPVLLNRKAARLRKESGNPALRSPYDQRLSPARYILKAGIRASRMLIFSPVHLLLSLFCGIVYSYMYVLFVSVADVYRETYRFKPNLVGLSFLGIGAGFVLGQLMYGKLADPIFLRMAKKGGGTLKPEYRLPLGVFGAVVGCIGLLWYGWSARAHAHWIVPIIGMCVMLTGNIQVFLALQNYTIDNFGIFSASALAGNNLVRCVMATTLPLAVPPLYSSVGLGWGNTVFALIAAIMIPGIYVLMTHGERFRTLNMEKIMSL